MTTVLNLDDLASAPAPMRLVVGGITHEMREMSVQDYVDTLLTIKKLGKNPGVEDEANLLVTVILRSFPTLDEKTVRSWPLSYLHKIDEAVQTAAGAIATTDPEAAAEAAASGNLPAAS